MTQFRTTGWIFAGTGIFIGTLLSPILLFGLGHIFHEDWIKLSNIGQTYGFASAVLSGLALLAVAYSLIAQQRDSEITRIENQRALHTELLRMAIEDPTLIGAVMIGPSESLAFKRRHLYVNLIYQAARANYINSKVLTDDDIRDEVSYMFRGIAGRTYWKTRREREKKTAYDIPRTSVFSNCG